jgi:hypothetical protein
MIGGTSLHLLPPLVTKPKAVGTLAVERQRRQQPRQVVAPASPVGGAPNLGVIAAVYAVIAWINRYIANAATNRRKKAPSYGALVQYAWRKR